MRTPLLCGWLALAAVIACAGDDQMVDSTAATSAPPVETAPGVPLGQPPGTMDVPAQPIQWDRGQFEAFLATRAQVLIAPPPAPTATAAAVHRVPTLRAVPAARYGVEGTLVEAYILGDPIASLRAAREVAQLEPVPPVVFTSNNMLVVAYDTTPAVLRLRRVLSADTSRSGIQKQSRP